MVHPKYFSIVVIVGIFTAITIFAVENDIVKIGTSTEVVTLSPRKKINQPAPDFLDATFLYEASPGHGPVKFSVKEPIVENANTQNLKRINDINLVSFGQSLNDSGVNPVKSFEESMSYLKKTASTLTSSEKILLLSLAGEKLGKGYDEKMPDNATSFEQLFENAKKGEVSGGVCRDIHAYLAEYAKALGFKNAGTYSFAFNSDNRHQVSYFKDDLTNNYLVQDYTQIINTGKTNLQEAIDVASAVEGVLSEVVYLNSPSGGAHAYTPSPARWIHRHMNAASRFDEKTIVTMNMGKEEQTLQVSMVNSPKESVRVKGFLLHSDYYSDEGPFRLDMFGMAAGYQSDTFIRNSWLSEVGIDSKATFGHTLFQNPLYLRSVPSQAPNTTTQENDVFSFSMKGHAQIDQLTGSLLIEGATVENTGGFLASPYTHQIRPQFSYNILSSIITTELARSLQILPVSMVDPGYSLKTVYDQFSVVVDSRTEKRSVYLYFRGDYYAFDGFDKKSAEGIKAAVKLAIPTEMLGEFALILDTSKIVSNRFSDPYFDSLPYSAATIQWLKDISRNIEFGTDLSAGNGRKPASYFEDPAKAVPTNRSSQPLFNGDVWIRFKF